MDAIDFAIRLGRFTSVEPWDARDVARLVVECGPEWLRPTAKRIEINTPRDEALRLVIKALKTNK